MFGYGRNSGISWFRDYGDALHKYNSTADIRGRTSEPKKPLGHRRGVDNYSIVKRDDGAIQCVLWKTPVVTFFPDNSVEITDGSWTTSSTAHFIEEVMGYGMNARVFNAHICVGVGDMEYRLLKDTPFKLVKDEQGYWRPVNVAKTYIHQVNRAGSNNVRKRYKDFLNYVDGIMKLRRTEEGVVFGQEEYREAFGVNIAGNAHLMADLSRPHYSDFVPTLKKYAELISDTNDETKHLSYYHALLILARAKGYVRWGDNSVEVNPMQARTIGTMAKELAWGIHRDECFVAVELPDGELKRDEYLRFYQTSWNNFHKELDNQG